MKTFRELTAPIKISNLRIHTSVLILFLVSVILGFWRMLAIAYILTALHEYAHIAEAKKLGTEVNGVEILPFGITMQLKNNCIQNPDDEIKIAAAGPIASIASAYAAYAFHALPYREFIIMTSLAVGIFNLLPVLPLDGGRIFRAFMVKKYGCIRANSYCTRFSKAAAAAVILFGAFWFYRTGFNFSFILAGAFLAANITEERKNSDFVIMKDILYSKKKISDGKITKTEFLAVPENGDPQKILSRLSYDKYHIIGIIDEQMKISGIITETELIEKIARLRL